MLVNPLPVCTALHLSPISLPFPMLCSLLHACLLHAGVISAVRELDPNRQLTDLAEDADLLKQLSAASKESIEAVKAQERAATNAKEKLRAGECVSAQGQYIISRVCWRMTGVLGVLRIFTSQACMHVATMPWQLNPCFAISMPEIGQRQR
jgi:hypothetical protein